MDPDDSVRCILTDEALKTSLDYGVTHICLMLVLPGRNSSENIFKHVVEISVHTNLVQIVVVCSSTWDYYLIVVGSNFNV